MNHKLGVAAKHLMSSDMQEVTKFTVYAVKHKGVKVQQNFKKHYSQY